VNYYRQWILIFFLFCLVPGSLFSNQDWQRLAKKPFLVHCHPEDMDTGKKVITMADEGLKKILQNFTVSLKREIIIIIASSEKEFRTLTGGQIPEWGIGAADPVQGVIFLKSLRFAKPEINLRQVVIHELSHVILGRLLEGNIPERWFDEGLAVYQSGEKSLSRQVLFAKSLFTGDILGLDGMDDVLTFHHDKAGLAYEEAYSAVKYLVDKYGKNVLLSIIEALRQDNDMEKALSSATGIGFQEFHAGWFKAMRRKYRFYIILDYPFIISFLLVILFVSAILVTRRRMSMKKRFWDEEAEFDTKISEVDSTQD